MGNKTFFQTVKQHVSSIMRARRIAKIKQQREDREFALKLLAGIAVICVIIKEIEDGRN